MAESNYSYYLNCSEGGLFGLIVFNLPNLNQNISLSTFSYKSYLNAPSPVLNLKYPISPLY
jgi:hypothetical protein